MNKQLENSALIIYVGTHRLAGVLAESDGGRILKTGEIVNPDGFQKGEVAQIEKALISMGDLLNQLELGEAALEIPVYVLLSNSHLKMTRFSTSIYFPGYPRVVTSREVKQVIKQTRNVAPLSLDDWVLQTVPESFWVNDLTGVEDPIGLEAQRLAVSLQIFSTRYAAIRNLSKLFESMELNVRGYFPKTQVLPGILNAAEKEGEVLVLEFSDDTTHLVLNRDGKLAQTKTLDFGSRFFTQKIAEKWQISMRDAERLKEQFGSLEESLQFGDELIPLVERNGQGNHSIKRSEFHQVFFQLVEEFWNKLKKELDALLEREKAAHCAYILTGGGAKLDGWVEFLSRKLSSRVRLATPRPVEGASSVLLDPSWSGPLELVRWLGETPLLRNRITAKESVVERAILQFKEWLVAYF